LLGSYRLAVREVIGRFDGAEIRTEGDSFYVVFPSASDAILAGLAILREAVPAEGGPIGIGVGVHAGEATETDEGYVGWAVNVAARVCAAAQAGEVLVTDTVRGLTRGHTAFRFESRGRRRLKGVAEPVPLFAVSPAGAQVVPRRALARRPALMGNRLNRLALPIALAIGVLVLTAAAIALFGEDLGGTAREEPTIEPAAGTSPSTVALEATATPSPDPAAQREAANERLRSRIDDEVARLCTAADPEDAPTVYLLDPEPPRPLVTLAGLRCDLGGGGAPDVVSYWLAEREEVLQNRRPDSALYAFFSTAGERNISPGDCATETRAWGPWEFGSSSPWSRSSRHRAGGADADTRREPGIRHATGCGCDCHAQP
jgi:hypothetical protein